MDAGTPKGGDGGCGSNGGSGWCVANASTATASSNLLCDDFDFGVLTSGTGFGGQGITSADLVNTHYVSPYCSMTAYVNDGGTAAAPAAAFTSHTYEQALGPASATIAFDLWIPGGTACEGASVAYFVAVPDDNADGAVEAWLNISDIVGSGAMATSYSVSLRGFAGAAPGGTGMGATPTNPVTVKVTPASSDDGWARVELDVTKYALNVSPTPSTGAAVVSWFTVSNPKAVATSAAISMSGMISSAGLGLVEADVGLLPDGVTGTTVSGCRIFVDNFVSNLIK